MEEIACAYSSNRICFVQEIAFLLHKLPTTIMVSESFSRSKHKYSRQAFQSTMISEED